MICHTKFKLMFNSVQRIGITVFTVSCLGLFSSVDIPATQAQEIKKAVNCLPNVTTGQVSCEYNNGDKYIGAFVNGLPNGSGIYIYGNGDRFIGLFRNGLPNGQGRFMLKDNTRIEGVFNNGILRRGEAIFANGTRYVGEFAVTGQIGTFHGKGQITFPNGERFEGQFLEGSPLGPGVFTTSDQTRCQGDFYNQSFDGRGSCIFANGSRYEGEFRSGVPGGFGTLTDPSGKRSQGLFENGKLIP